MGLALAFDGIHMAFAVTRPPGHMANRYNPSALCFANNAAIAAQVSILAGNRVAILDTDWSHGQGTQRIFYESPVLVCNVNPVDNHMTPSAKEAKSAAVGKGEGLGYNVNVVMRQESDDSEYAHVLREFVLPMIKKYNPDVLIWSVGFEILQQENLGTRCTPVLFGAIANAIRELNTPTGVVLEGGFTPRHIHKCIFELIKGANGLPTKQLDTIAKKSRRTEKIIANVVKSHTQKAPEGFIASIFQNETLDTV